MRAGRLVMCAVALLVAAPAQAADPAATPSPLDGYPAGPVNAVAVSGATAYVGGAFRHIGPFTGSFASVDPVSGVPVAGRPAVDGTVIAAVPDGEGGFYIAGFFTHVGDVERDGLARIRADGSADPAWAPTIDGSGSVGDIALLGQQVFVGGQFASVNGGTTRTNLAAFDAGTGAVTAFNGGVGIGTQRVRSLGVIPPSPFGGDPGLVVVGGSFGGAGGNAGLSNLAALKADTGLAESTFDPVVNGQVADLAVVNLGTAVVPNFRVWIGGEFSAKLAAVELDGDFSSWTPSPAFPGTVETLAASSTHVYVGGTPTFSGSPAPLRGYALSNGAALPAFAEFGGGFHTIRALLPLAGTLYVGGRFSTVDGEPRTNVAAIDAQTGEPRAWDPEATANAINTLVSDGERVFVGGDQVTTGGVERRGIAAFDLASGALLPFAPDVPGPVDALVADGPRLYAGGSFETVNGSVARRGLAAFDRGSGAVTSFDAGLNGPVRALAISQGDVVAAGTFTTVNGGAARDGLTKFDPITGAARDLYPEITTLPLALLARDSAILVGGFISDINGITRTGAAGLVDVPGTIGALSPFDPRTGSSVHALAQDERAVYLGGQFSTVGGIARERLAAVDPRTGALLEPPMDTNTLVLALERVGDRLIVAGAGGDRQLYAVDPLTGTRTGWVPVDQLDQVGSLAWSPEGGIVAGGNFSRPGQPATPSPRVAWFPILPSAPPTPVATAGDRSASIDVPAAASGGSAISEYRVVAEPGGRTVVAGAPGPVVVDGLENGTSYTFTVAATNAVGAGPPSPPSNPVTPAVAAVPGGPADATAPIVSALRVTPRRFALARRRTPLAARVRRGTTIRFTLSEDARTAIALQRARPGRRRAGRCVKPRQGSGRRCTRWVRVATLRRAATRQGANRVAFTGRAGRKALRRGRHRARLMATDAAGNRSRPATARFRVVRAR